MAFKLDRPWEGRFSNYTTVLADRLPLPHVLSRRSCRRRRRLKQGHLLRRVRRCDSLDASGPGLLRSGGSTAQQRDPGARFSFSHNFTPFLDGRAGVPAEERYKALAGQAKTGLFAFVSADGLKWTKRQGEPALPPPSTLALDSQNIAFWSPHENRYVLYYRTWKKIGKVNYRWASRAVSDDFRHFIPAGEMDFGDAPPEHLYTNQTSNTFGRRTFTSASAPASCRGGGFLTDDQAKAINVDPRYFQDCSDAVLVSSRGGNHYTRTFMEAFLRPGIGIENWVSRSNYPSLNLIHTGPSSMSFFVNRNYGQPTSIWSATTAARRFRFRPRRL